MTDDRRVFAVPVRLIVDCTLFVLTTTAERAERHARFIDLHDYFTFGPTYVRTDADGFLKIANVMVAQIATSTIDITQLTTEEYPPNLHPDYIGIRR